MDQRLLANIKAFTYFKVDEHLQGVEVNISGSTLKLCWQVQKIKFRFSVEIKQVVSGLSGSCSVHKFQIKVHRSVAHLSS
jgi:hypothetical protein